LLRRLSSLRRGGQQDEARRGALTAGPVSEENESRPAHVWLWSLVAIGLIVALPFIMGADFARLWTAVVSIPMWAFLCAMVAQALIMAFGAEKWRRVLAALPRAPVSLPFSAALSATTIGAGLGQILSIQIVTPMARAWVGRRWNVPLGRSVGASLYEQLFELMALAAAGAISALVLIFGFGLGMAGIAAGALLIVLAVLIRPAMIVSGRAALLFAIGPLSSFGGKLSEGFAEASELAAATLRLLISLSIIRYLIIMGLNVGLLVLIAPEAPALNLALAYPLVLFIMTLPIVPGGLGVTELAWSGVLLHAGLSSAEAIEAALTLRIVSTAAFFAVTPLLMAIGRIRV
ncbi:MAG: lysylphosphatidylglycerol synthase transmembrane domain-containing protein, partial [Pseudomonadota bacterium]